MTERWHLEVKGVSSSMPSILLSRDELRAAENDKAWSLDIVTTALSGPDLQEFSRESVLAQAEPSAYGVNLGL